MSKRRRNADKPGKIRRVFRAVFPPLEEWKRALPAFGLAVLSAALLRMAYQPLHWSFIAFFALVPLFWGLRRCKPAMAFWVGLLFGSINGWLFTSWLTIVSRFNELIYLGMVPLSLWFGVHIAVALTLIVWFGRRLSPWAALPLGMLAWAGMEHFKMIGAMALPYGLLGQSQAGWASMAHFVAFAGVPLLSALIIGVNLALMETAAVFHARYGHAGAFGRLGGTVVLAILALWWGSRELSQRTENYETGDTVDFRVALLQPNIEQELKFSSYSEDDDEKRSQLQDQITRIQLSQIEELKPGEVDLIVTPESSFTTSFFDAEEQFQRNWTGGVVQYEVINRAKELQAPIIVGANETTFRRADGDPTELVSEGFDPATGMLHPGYRYYGGLWVFRPDDPLTVQMESHYRKVHLMPFGEYVPYLGIIPGFASGVVGIGSFEAGDLGPPIGVLLPPDSPSSEPVEVRLGMTICFEDLFPYIHNHYARNNTQVIINTTNDSWFDGSSGPAWHMNMARWRCIETGLPMLRCTNTGITALIGYDGALVETIPPGEQGILRADVALLTDPPKTPYARFGNWFGWLAMIGSALAWFGLLRRRDEEHAAPSAPEPEVDDLLE